MDAATATCRAGTVFEPCIPAILAGLIIIAVMVWAGYRFAAGRREREKGA